MRSCKRFCDCWGASSKNTIHDGGHAECGVYLQAAAINLGTVTIGSFDDDNVREVLGLPENTTPLYLMPVGRPVPGKG